LSSFQKYSSTQHSRTIVTFKTTCPFQLLTSYTDTAPFFLHSIGLHNLFRAYVKQYTSVYGPQISTINCISEDLYF